MAGKTVKSHVHDLLTTFLPAYCDAHADCLDRIKTIELSMKAEILGIQKQDQLFVFDFIF